MADLAVRLSDIEKNVVERDAKNRKDIHDLKGGQQLIADQQHLISGQVSDLTDSLAPWLGGKTGVNILMEIRNDVKGLGTRLTGVEQKQEISVAVHAESDKKLRGSLNKLMLICTAVIAFTGIVALMRDGCGHQIARALDPTISQVSPKPATANLE